MRMYVIIAIIQFLLKNNSAKNANKDYLLSSVARMIWVLSNLFFKLSDLKTKKDVDYIFRLWKLNT